MRIHFVLHETFEAPGAYLAWAALCGHEVSMTKIYRYEKLPESMDDFDMLILMGGPQSPSSTKKDFPYYDAQAEINLIQKAVKAHKIIIGVCLGAQLLGLAFGADYCSSPQKEIGNYLISLTEAGKQDPLLADFADGTAVGHWHGDMPGLTDEALVLAASKGCPRQIIKYADKVYAFQCHLEFSKELVKALLAHEVNYDQQVQEEPYYQPAWEILDYDYSKMNQVLYRFLDKLTAEEN
ncbi:glutamine amidotransferase-related protein [Streptococcus macacae]|uniref:Class I glutamine amidotransferase n=1 Tax=Streptococcus macacae NCTC 11558 TaxID=764298 RepID=G5JUJ8_9STRE|nr:gamma-glutamyl-gamma-aminobutyrate hydrolase family protein [Streptococcus macacae]EHJ52208.1 class I glutamine amidotransferase [Streptococcus macacae NCTC 11558]SUN78639.1 glutamine amidotransferase [Streptococcus macacae NCTC 11558]